MSLTQQTTKGRKRTERRQERRRSQRELNQTIEQQLREAEELRAESETHAGYPTSFDAEYYREAMESLVDDAAKLAMDRADILDGIDPTTEATITSLQRFNELITANIEEAGPLTHEERLQRTNMAIAIDDLEYGAGPVTIADVIENDSDVVASLQRSN